MVPKSHHGQRIFLSGCADAQADLDIRCSV